MTAGKYRNRDKTSTGHRHNDQLRDSIPRLDHESGCRVSIEQGDSDFSAVASIHRSRTVNDSDAVLCSQTASGHNKSDVPVGQRNRHASIYGVALPRRQGVVASRVEVSSCVARVRISGDVPSGDKHLYVVDHESRLVQIGSHPETQPAKRCLMES
jgi:hypothetical protein